MQRASVIQNRLLFNRLITIWFALEMQIKVNDW